MIAAVPRSYDSWRSLLLDERLPAALVDLDAVDRNLARLLARLADGPTLRIASKSLRVPGILERLLESERVAGVMTYAADELLLLADRGITDLLAGYPIARAADAAVFAELATREGVQAIAMVDSVEHVALLAAAATPGHPIPLCLDVDVSLQVAGQHLGVRRSPIRDVPSALAFARAVQASEGVQLVAVMAYEAQVAGLPDRVPGQALLAPARRWIKARSCALAADRRRAIVQALSEAGHPITLVNGGGTGSVHSTSHDGTVTEVTAGSGFFCPALFDGYDDLPLEPGAFFALPVVRSSDPGYVTCATGGFVASGPPGPDLAPRVHLPEGLSTVSLEGFGEVQTPFRVAGVPPSFGDPVLCRHAKAGEVMERFNEVLLVQGDAIVGRSPTYRGLGASFT